MEIQLKLRVISKNMETDEIELSKVIDHNDRDDRVWLGKHCFWAFRNGRAVTTEPVLTTPSNSENRGVGK